MARSKMASAPFLAWDTEGLGAGPRHRCVLLVTSEQTRAKDAAGLGTRALLGKLWHTLHHRADALHVAFAFGYDVQMILRDLPQPVAAVLWAEGRVRWGPYRLGYVPRHEFTVAKRIDGRWTGGRIWDTFGYFQSSFLTALERYDVARDVQGFIAEMKGRRASFQRRDLDRMERYSRAECVALTQLMDRVRQAALDAGLPLNRWDGAGSVASALLRQQHAERSLPRGPTPRQGDPWPEQVRDAARYAYFGGRIEDGQVGHHAGPVQRYDVRSAYPAIMAGLPDGGGNWERREGAQCYDIAPDAWALAYVRWTTHHRARWHPFPWRARDGAVLYPPQGEGWYWWPEVQAAARAGHGLELPLAWVYQPLESAARPWQWIAAQYDRRAQLKAAGKGEEKILKLGLNSLYGKMAQSLGGTADTHPRWHCLEWAGYITSAIRARLYAAAVAAGPRAIACATDALFTVGRVRALDAGVGPGLGEWERTGFQSATFVQSGVYWVGHQEGEYAYHRGFSPAVLHRRDILAHWRAGRAECAIPETRFQALGASVGSASAYARRGQWLTALRTLAVVPYAGQKRLVPLGLRPRALARSLHWTVPRAPLAGEGYDPTAPARSAPVALPWLPDGIPPLDGRAATEYDSQED